MSATSTLLNRRQRTELKARIATADDDENLRVLVDGPGIVKSALMTNGFPSKDDFPSRDDKRRERSRKAMPGTAAVLAAIFLASCFVLGYSAGLPSAPEGGPPRQISIGDISESLLDSGMPDDNLLIGKLDATEKSQRLDEKVQIEKVDETERGERSSGSLLPVERSDRKVSIENFDVPKKTERLDKQAAAIEKVKKISIAKVDEPQRSKIIEQIPIEKVIEKEDEPAQSGRLDDSNISPEELYEIRPLPNNWETFSFERIHQHFNCWAHAHDQSRPLHSLEQWQYMRRKYNEVVDSTVKFDDQVPPTMGYALRDNSPPPFHAKYSPGMGRGVFATSDIKAGKLVHDGTISAMTFPDAMAWRQYVFSLPRDMACDVAEWSWTQKLFEKGPIKILVDLNIAAFFNSGNGEERNVRPKNNHSLKFYATRNIEKGTELLYDYSVYETVWRAVGLK